MDDPTISEGTVEDEINESEAPDTREPSNTATNTEDYRGRSDDEFRVWVHEEMTNLAPQVQELYPDLFEKCAAAVTQWRKRYHGNSPVWNRLWKQEKIIKEVVEAVPVIDVVQDWMRRHDNVQEKITIIDLCSGKGYLSMLLSEILPPDRVDKCLLVDKAWSCCHLTPKAHHISWEHIYGHVDGPRYFDTWPIPLITCRQNLKRSGDIRYLQERFSTSSDDDDKPPQGPVLILAIHLCGVLSIQAIKLFQTIPAAQMLVLKPCCLPDIWHIKNTQVFQVGTYSFPAKDVCARGNWTSKKKKGKVGRWDGPPRWHLESKFQNWCQYLGEAMEHQDEIATTNDCNDQVAEAAETATAERDFKRFDVPLQTKGGFQNTFLYAEKV